MSYCLNGDRLLALVLGRVFLIIGASLTLLLIKSNLTLDPGTNTTAVTTKEVAQQVQSETST